MMSSKDNMIDRERRRLIGAAALAVSAAPLSLLGTTHANAQGAKVPLPVVKPDGRKVFAPLKQIRAGVLDVGYVEDGPADGPPVILLHGWPYDIYSYVDVAPVLAAKGYRVIVPYLRGFGTTHFLSDKTFRNGQQAALAADIVAFMDALKIPQAVIGGFDWGARTACVIAALWPQRCKALVSVSGYLIVNLASNLKPLAPQAELGWWYQYYFSTPRGELGYRQNTREFNRLIWSQASPRWKFDDATYDRSAAAFDNPDHVDIVIHNYRWRLSLAQGEPQYDAVDRQLAGMPPITVPAITIASDFDGPAKDGSAYRQLFTRR